MAMRKMGNSMKIITIIIALCMIIPIAIQGYAFLFNRESKTVLLKIDGEKIYKEDFDKLYKEVNTQLKQLVVATPEGDNKDKNSETKKIELPDEVIKEYVLNNLILEATNKLLTKQLGAKVSKADIDAKYKELEDQVGGAKQLVAGLNAQGITVESLRDQIKSFLLNQKRLEIVESKIKVTDEEIKQRYDRLKFDDFQGKTFEESKEEVKQLILNEKGEIYIESLVQGILDNAKYKVYNDDIQAIVDKLNTTFFEQDIYVYKEYDVINDLVNSYVASPTGYDDTFISYVKEDLKKGLNSQIKLKDKALADGLKLNEDLLPKQQLKYIANDYIQYLFATYKADENEMKAIFNSTKSTFNTPHSVGGQVVAFEYKATSEDEKETEKYVKNLMKTLTKDNFAAKAKELSEDPGSKKNGGSLGKADISNYVTEFRDAVAAAKPGEIVGPVKTQFGYHIIYVVSKDSSNSNIAELRHILISTRIGDSSREAAKKTVLNLIDDINNNKVTWDSIKEDKTGKYKEFKIESFAGIQEENVLPIIGYNKDINKKLFAANVGETIEFKNDKFFAVIQKTSDIPFKEATFEDAKDKIKLILATQHVSKILNEL